MLKLCTIALISHPSKVMLKISKQGFKSMWTVNFQMFKLNLEKAKEPEIKLPTPLDLKKESEFQKNIDFCFIDYTKAFDCVDHRKLENFEKDGNTRPPGLPLRNLYAGQEATVWPGHGTRDWFQVGKRVHQGYILSLCLFNLFAECIMRNAGLEEAQAGIKIAERNINKLKYADDTTVMAESDKEL